MPIPPEALASGDDAFSDVATSDLSAVECAIYAFHLLSASHKVCFAVLVSMKLLHTFRETARIAK